jgi:hypothetical protein
MPANDFPRHERGSTRRLLDFNSDEEATKRLYDEENKKQLKAAIADINLAVVDQEADGSDKSLPEAPLYDTVPRCIAAGCCFIHVSGEPCDTKNGI